MGSGRSCTRKACPLTRVGRLEAQPLESAAAPPPRVPGWCTCPSAVVVTPARVCAAPHHGSNDHFR